jgi:hypothetical protein
MSVRRRAQGATDTFTLLKANAWIVALLAALVCVVLLVVVDGWAGTSKAVATNVLGALLSVALVSLVADVYFKTRFAQGFAELVELRDDTRRAGLQRIELGGLADWSWVLEDAKRVSLIIVDLQPWASANWRHLEGLAARRAVEIGISFAAPNSAACVELEGRLGRSLAATTREGETFLHTQWLDRQKHGALDPKAKIGTFELLHAPAYSAAVVERVDGHRRALVELAGSATMPLGSDSLLLAFDDATASSKHAVAGWLIKQATSLEQEDRRTWAGQGEAEIPDAPVGSTGTSGPEATPAGPATATNDASPVEATDSDGDKHHA